MQEPTFRARLIDYVRAEANPPDKFSHQDRLYQLACNLAENKPYDDDALFAAAWLHDLGVFVGHRPTDLAALATWDNTRYAMERAPSILKQFGFPEEKMAAVVEIIRTHQPAGEPKLFEAVLLRDADILEQLGAVGILRTVSKVGRDTRFLRFSDALRLLRQNLENLPGQLRLESAQKQAEPRLQILRAFLGAAQAEAAGKEW
jgi:uncharacterized protein